LKNSFSLLAVLLLFISIAPSGFAQEQERIKSYHSEIQIALDGSMVVAETIDVVARGRNIRRGIYRDFPTTYTDGYGNRYRVGFEVLNVTRDGATEPWRAENRGNGVRIYIGNADILLPPGFYSYAITYRTNRQLGFFADHDELYWNVTGNGWDFAIEQAGADVTLPASIAAAQLQMEGYTGSSGATGTAYTASVSDGEGSIATTATLNSREGLTLVFSFPKGVIQEPGLVQKAGYLLSDNIGLLLSVLTLLGIAVYYYVVWSAHGKDPDKGVIFPHYAPPDGFSPASARFILKMSYDTRTFAAAIVNLAVKGYLTIQQDKKEYSLHRTVSSETLAAGESVLLKRLFNKGPLLELKEKNHSTISAAQKAHKASLKNDYVGTYFKTNSLFLLPPMLAAIAALAIIGLLGAVTIFVGAIFTAIFVLELVFFFLMRAPTAKGRAVMDKLEGFKLFLNVAEKDDLNLRNPPELTPELFEQFLPYAMALNVEQVWAERFASVFANLERSTGTTYHPLWYHGAFSYGNMSGFSKDISSSFSSSIASAATPPGSSSGGGGGGSSGGGGGGGGGGGW